MKGEIDLVTEADKGCEKLFHSFVKKYFPEDSVLAEEGGRMEGNSAFRWIIDPLDGTTNFSHRIPLYAISIGIEDREFNVVGSGIVALPSLGDVYHAVKTKGAFKNKKKIHVSKSKKLIDSVLCTGFPYKKDKKELAEIMRILQTMLTNTRGIRRTGAAALDLAWVAEGRFDGFWESNLNPWDVAAGGVLVIEAGGEVSDFSGNPFDPYSKSIIATNGNIHSNILKCIRNK